MADVTTHSTMSNQVRGEGPLLRIELIQSLNCCYCNSFGRRIVLSDALMKTYETPGSQSEFFDHLLDGGPNAKNINKKFNKID